MWTCGSIWRSWRSFSGSSPRGPLAERVLEVVGVLAIRDLDRHFAREPHQLFRTRVRHDGDRQSRLAAGHGAAVLEHEGAAPAVQRAADPFECDIAGRALHLSAGGQHLALAGRFEIAMELL